MVDHNGLTKMAKKSGTDVEKMPYDKRIDGISYTKVPNYAEISAG